MLAAGSVQAGTSYVLSAPKWGELQDKHVAAMGGVIRFADAETGVAVVESDNPQFLSQVLAGGAITGGAEDMMVQWTNPVATFELQEDVVDPSDDRFYNTIQWAPQAVKAPAAWAAGYTGAGVRVAIIDGGIHAAHQDLDANVDVAASRSFASGVANGCVEFFNCDTGTFWHGTHVAGIVAAEDNELGTVGIAPHATIVGVKALHGGSGSFGAVIMAILYASDQGATGGRADIINMSLGARFQRREPGAASLISAMNKAINTATRRGVLVVSSAGNNAADMDHSQDFINTPAESGNGLAVSATGPFGFAYGATDYDRFASYSNWGTSAVSVAGPGGDFAWPTNELCTLPTTAAPVTIPCWAFDMVLSTSRGPVASTTSYSWSAGTSMSAPAASAVAALIKQKHPGISVGALKNRLMQSASDAGKIGRDPFYGAGFINAENAVK